MRKFLLAFGLLVSTAAHADFKMDLSGAEVRAKTRSPAIIDLMVGEKGLILAPSLCTEKDKLYLNAMWPLSEKRSDHFSTWTLTRRPGGKIALDVELGSLQKDATVRGEVARYLGGALTRPCLFSVYPLDDYIEVDSINSKNLLSDFIDP